MKKVFLLLLITSQLISFSANDRYDYITAFGLGGVCLFVTGYFTYSAYGEQKKFDKDKEVDISNRNDWAAKAERVKNDGGYKSEQFPDLYNEAVEKKLIIFLHNKTAEQYKREYCRNKNEQAQMECFQNLVNFIVKGPDGKYDEENRPPLLTYKTITLGIATLAFFGFGIYKYHSANS